MWCRVLLLDDDPQVLNALRRELMRKPDIGHDGLEVEAFVSQDEALARVGEAGADFDLAIVDYHMRGMDGIAFLSRLHAIQPETVRILLTGGADLGGAVKAINDARVDFLILKPWLEYDLKGRIALALHQRRLLRERGAGKRGDAGASGHRRPYRLMLVDDEESVLAALEREISMGGAATAGRRALFQIHGYTSPLEALVAAAEECPDVIISDYSMQEMDGVSFFRRMREVCPDAVRILLSGRADVGVLIDAINEAGVYHFLRKPWNDGELTAMLTQALLYRDILTGGGEP